MKLKRIEMRGDDRLAVVTRVEKIAAPIPGLASRLKPVLSAVRDGAVAHSPAEVRAYLIGALHALRLADDDFFILQDALDGPLMS